MQLRAQQQQARVSASQSAKRIIVPRAATLEKQVRVSLAAHRERAKRARSEDRWGVLNSLSPRPPPLPSSPQTKQASGRGGIAAENYVDQPPVSLLREGIDGPET